MAEGDFPDTEDAMKAYLKADSGVSAIVGSRVFFGSPKQGATLPYVVLARIGGGDDGSEAPIDNAVLNLSCWGRSKEEAFNTANAVRKALRTIRRRTLASGVNLHGAIVDTLLWSPDPQDDTPRYIVTTRVTATAAA